MDLATLLFQLTVEMNRLGIGVIPLEGTAEGTVALHLAAPDEAVERLLRALDGSGEVEWA